MAHTIEVNGEFASALTVHYPGFGVPTFTVRITLAKKLASEPLGLTIKYDGLTLRGSVVSYYQLGEGFDVSGVLGAYGWGKTTKPKAYSDPSGVKLATVLSSLESSTGETFAEKPSTSVGPFYVDPAGPAAWSLSEVAPLGWYVGLDGKTRLGKWPDSAAKARYEITSVDQPRRVVTIGADSLAEWMPGVSFTHPRTGSGVVEGVTHVVTPEMYRAICTLRKAA